MEEVEILATDIAIIGEDARACIQEFCEKEGIEDMRRAPQTIYTACMTYVGRRLFGGNKKGKNPYFITKQVGVNGDLVNGVDLDEDKLKIATECYIELCRLYDKVCTLGGLCSFLGISKGYFRENKNSELKQLIYGASEDTASEVLLGGKRPPMSVLPYLNHFHGWTRDVSGQEETVESGSKSLPDLSGYLPKKEQDG